MNSGTALGLSLCSRGSSWGRCAKQGPGKARREGGGPRSHAFVSPVPPQPKPTKGRMRIHCLENVDKALQFLKEQKVHLENMGSHDIVDGNHRLTLGLVWTIILRFQVPRQSVTRSVRCTPVLRLKQPLLVQGKIDTRMEGLEPCVAICGCCGSIKRGGDQCGCCQTSLANSLWPDLCAGPALWDHMLVHGEWKFHKLVLHHWEFENCIHSLVGPLFFKFSYLPQENSHPTSYAQSIASPLSSFHHSSPDCPASSPRVTSSAPSSPEQSSISFMSET